MPMRIMLTAPRLAETRLQTAVFWQVGRVLYRIAASGGGPIRFPARQVQRIEILNCPDFGLRVVATRSSFREFYGVFSHRVTPPRTGSSITINQRDREKPILFASP